MLLCILTAYKRSTTEEQLKRVLNQTLKPDIIVVFQNGNYVNIESLKEKYEFYHVKSDFNTKFFGRFTYALNFDVEYCIIMDDDIFPGKKCFERYVKECKERNAIMGGNGRHTSINPKNDTLLISPESGIRSSRQFDFVGHLWCFKKEWLYYMFAMKPCTMETGEDMHLCFSAKKLGGICSFVCGHNTPDEDCDQSRGRYAGDDFASYKITPRESRVAVERYFKETIGLNFIESNT
jgi:hypothetical protein